MSDLYSNKFIASLLDIHDPKFILWSHDSHQAIHIDEDLHTIHISLTTQLSPSVCPHCGVVANHYFKDYRTVTLSHIIFNDYIIYLTIRYRRYKCLYCQPPGRYKSFKEDIPFRLDSHRFTLSFARSLMFHLKENYSLQSIARTHHISYSSLYHIFTHHIQLFHHQYKLPTYLSIDEFKATTDKGKYAFNICDPQSGKVLDILEDRRLQSVIPYFMRFSKENRDNVHYISMDMSGNFRSIMKQLFPNALIVVDRFHIVQHLSRNFIKERVRIMNESPKRQYKLFKTYWKLFLKKNSSLDKETVKWNKHIKMYVSQETLVTYLLGLNDELNELYHLYQDFLVFMHSVDGNAHIQLRDWIENVRDNGNPSFCKVADTFENWFEEIIQSKKVKLTINGYHKETYLNNGFIEAQNNKIKLIKRNAYGYRYFHHFKKRVLIHLGFGFTICKNPQSNIMMY